MKDWSKEKVAGLSQSDAIALLERITRIESPTEDIDGCKAVTEEANRIITELLGSPGELALVNGHPTLSWKSGKPRVLLLCHLDTVWPKGSFQPLWSVDGDLSPSSVSSGSVSSGSVIRGPGVYDMKAGFIQAVIATAALENRDGIHILATTDEESGSAASKELIEASAKESAYVLVFESAINGKVKTARKGTSMYHLHVAGRASHAGLDPEKGINAMLALASLVEKIPEFARSEVGTSVVPTTFHAGTTLNTVPAEAEVAVDVRAFSREEQERVDRGIKSLAGTLPTGAILTVKGGINRPALDPKMSKELFLIAQESAKAIGMATLEDAAVGGASDGNFTAALGIPTLDGLGAVGDGAHAAHEHILAAGLMERSALVAEMLRRLSK